MANSNAINAVPPADAGAQAQKEKPKRTAKRKPAAKKAKIAARTILVKSKRKEAIARASVRGGSGVIRINGSLIDNFQPEGLRRFVLEPVFVSGATQAAAKAVDIRVNLSGGGMVARAEAARSAIAKALANFSDNDIIRREYLQHDRSMLKDDSRRVEPKKYKGPKARARFQTSYR